MKKIIGVLALLIVVAIGSIIGYKSYLKNKADNELREYKEQVEEFQAEVKSESELFEDSLKSKVSGKLQVTENSIGIKKHTTTYSEKIDFNMYGERIESKATVKKSGSATLLYEYNIDLNQMESSYNKDDDTIYIKIPKPQLNENSVKIKEGSIKLNNESGINFAGKVKIGNSLIQNKKETMDARAERKFEEEIVTLGKEKIKTMYSDDKSKYNDICDMGLDLMNDYIDKIIELSDLEKVNFVVEYK